MPTNPASIYVGQETLNFRYEYFSYSCRVLMRTLSLVITPPNLTIELHSSIQRFATIKDIFKYF